VISYQLITQAMRQC